MTVQIKYCGCQSEEDYSLLIKTNADLVGFIFAESKRKVNASDVKNWIEKYGNPKQLVGVFQNASMKQITDVLSEAPIDIIQCHGDESVEMIEELSKRFNKKIYKALPYNKQILEDIEIYAHASDAIIVDSVSKGRFGGTGFPFSWVDVPLMMKKAEQVGTTCFIAGGISPDNVSELVRYNPHGIDLSGGIEENGKKSVKRIEQLERMIMR
ncbi:phosphoribosylanthranilate isomerase [Fictibacillus sp. b24]|uniref:phosphoribosylanthranilate isomerase n=1 Tax=Fictibacillus sp. b24 TaxID=3055863 RepID=UPI0025A1A4FF|nr:phosphoribosylanthranilate isomerase [Fictibacillus sp. b24]MDM5316114.1 phosphoribosylanthranilate isomerase [Fictibacillus sp. b24]